MTHLNGLFLNRFKYLSDNSDLGWTLWASGYPGSEWNTAWNSGNCVAVMAFYEGRELEDRWKTVDCEWTGQVICQEH